jgi:hypothetical protein
MVKTNTQPFLCETSLKRLSQKHTFLCETSLKCSKNNQIFEKSVAKTNTHNLLEKQNIKIIYNGRNWLWPRWVCL